ncbi:MAG: MBL fold metallo-hydrolase [Ruminococcus sp.]|nr:MBL fold metallo-hydrolase [Ruminococcus sp.]
MEKQKQFRITEEQRKKLRKTVRKHGKHFKKASKKKKGLNIALVLILLLLAGVFLWLHNRRNEPELEVNSDLSVHYIDVGQGDCELLVSGGKTMLIDCGESQYAGKVTDYLRELGVKRLDYVVATHPHSDHMGGMASVMKQFDIGEVIMPPLPDEDVPTTNFFENFLSVCEDKGLELTEAKVGDELEIGDARAKVVAPNSAKYEDLNNYSVVLLVTHGSKKFIFDGDAEKLSEKEMISGGMLCPVDVYKVGHHGSNSSSCAAYMKEIQPKIAVISCGAGNPYGHPKDGAIKRMSPYTEEIYRTDLCGTINIVSDGKELTVRTERN